MGSAKDAQIAAYAREMHLCLLSGDFGFADIRHYPSGSYAGLVVLELPKHATEQTILHLVDMILSRSELLDRIPGRLAIVSLHRVRLRSPAEQ